MTDLLAGDARDALRGVALKAPFRVDDLTLLRNFAAKVRITDTCWLWEAALREKGYGAFSYYGRVICAHRAAWLMFVDDIPEGKCVLHHCDNAACVNPNHLWLGSKADNNVDMTAKGRHVPGGTHCGKNGKWKRGENHWHWGGKPPRKSQENSCQR